MKLFFEDTENEILTDGYPTQDKQNMSGAFKQVYVINQNMKRALLPRINSSSETFHNSSERTSRNNNVSEYEKEHPGEPRDLFMVDRGNKDGKEIHVVKSNAIVEIYNYNKVLKGQGGLITKLIARPSQISRYYKWCNIQAPSSLLKLARENEDNGYNFW